MKSRKKKKSIIYQNKDKKSTQIASRYQMLLANHIFSLSMPFLLKWKMVKSLDYLLEELGKVSIGKSSVAER